MLVITAIVLYQVRSAGIDAQLAHIVSISQTLLALISNAAWLFIIAPMFFPNQPLATKVADVLVSAVSLERHTSNGAAPPSSKVAALASGDEDGTDADEKGAVNVAVHDGAH